MKGMTVGYTGLHIEYDADVHVSAALRSHGYYVIAVAEGAACDAVATGRGNCDFGDYTLFCMSPVAMASALVGTVAMPRTLRMLVAFIFAARGVAHVGCGVRYNERMCRGYSRGAAA